MALVIAVAFAAAVAVSGNATTTTYTVRTFTEPAKSGLAVTGPLSDFVVTSSARVVVPATTWKSRSAPAGRLRFTTRQNPDCSYDVTYRVASLLAPSRPAADYVAAKLPAASSKHLLDSGTRGNRAFRVVRQPGLAGKVRVDALWAGVLTKRADIVPSGQVAWTEIRVTALERAGSECHAGTWRETLGLTIGDSLAVARTKLHFVRTG